MKPEEIQEAAKEAGLVSANYQHDETDNEAWRDVSRFAAIIERKTIERVLRGLRSENDSQQLRAILASVETMLSNTDKQSAN